VRLTPPGVPQDDPLSCELTFLVLHALRGGPCVEAAAALERVRGNGASRATAGADAARAHPARAATPTGSRRAWLAAAALRPHGAARAARRAADRGTELRRGAARGARLPLSNAHAHASPLPLQLASRHPHVAPQHLRALLEQLLRLDAARRPLGCAPATLLGAGDAGLVPSRRLPALPRWTRWPHARTPMPQLQVRCPCAAGCNQRAL